MRLSVELYGEGLEMEIFDPDKESLSGIDLVLCGRLRELQLGEGYQFAERQRGD